MEFGKVQFSQGLYFGTVENGKANGYGRIKFNNGDVYVGEMKDNCMTGIGAKSTSSYISMGYFLNGQRHGSFCTIEKSNGGLYIGNYSNDKKSGQGTFVFKSDEIYVGNFENDLPNGSGYLSHFPAIDSGYFAQGYFVNGKLSEEYCRYCRTKFIDGTIFYGERNFADYYWGFGEWVDKGAHPFKKIGYHNQANSKCFKFSGSVISEDASGKKGLTVGDYGTYTNKYGKFSTIFRDDSMYIGNFENSNLSGQGILCNTHLGNVSSIYIGNFKAGRKSGKGICVSDGFYILENGNFSFGELDSGFILIENGEVNNKTNYSGEKSNNFSKPPILSYSGTLNGGVNPPSNSSSSFSHSAPSRSAYPSAAAHSPQSSASSTYVAPSSTVSTATTPQPITPWGKKAARLEEEKREEEKRKEWEKLQRKRKREARVPNENIQKINEEYSFEKSNSPRSVLNEVRIKKETHVLPSTITTVKSSAFCGDETVKEVVFNCKDEKVTLEAGAFKGCKNLETVDFSNTSCCHHDRYDGYFPEEAFKDCVNLKTIILPHEGVSNKLHYNDLTDSEYRAFVANPNAFENCNDVTFVKIDPQDPNNEITFDKLTFFAYRLFDGVQTAQTRIKRMQIKIEETAGEDFVFTPTKEDLVCLSEVNSTATEISVPFGVEALGEGAFDKVKNTVTEIKLPESLKSIEPGYFEGFENLETINVPSYCCICVPENAFKNCAKLRRVDFHDGFSDESATISKNAFENCVSLQSISTGAIRRIESEAFKNCANLHSLQGKYLKKIEKDAFIGCDKLQTVKLSEIKDIDEGAFPENFNKSLKKDFKSGHKIITLKQKGSKAKNFLSNVIYKIKKIFY